MTTNTELQRFSGTPNCSRCGLATVLAFGMLRQPLSSVATSCFGHGVWGNFQPMPQPHIKVQSKQRTKQKAINQAMPHAIVTSISLWYVIVMDNVLRYTKNKSSSILRPIKWFWNQTRNLPKISGCYTAWDNQFCWSQLSHRHYYIVLLYHPPGFRICTITGKVRNSNVPPHLGVIRPGSSKTTLPEMQYPSSSVMMT